MACVHIYLKRWPRMLEVRTKPLPQATAWPFSPDIREKNVLFLYLIYDSGKEPGSICPDRFRLPIDNLLTTERLIYCHAKVKKYHMLFEYYCCVPLFMLCLFLFLSKQCSYRGALRFPQSNDTRPHARSVINVAEPGPKNSIKVAEN